MNIAPAAPEPDEEPKVPDPAEAFFAKLNGEESRLVRKAFSYLGRSRVNGLCGHLYVGKVATRLSDRDDGYGAKLVERFAALCGLKVDVVYKARQVVESLGDIVVHEIFRLVEEGERVPPYSQVQLLAGAPNLPADPAARVAWLLEELKRVAADGLTVREVRKRLRPGPKVATEAGEPQADAHHTAEQTVDVMPDEGAAPDDEVARSASVETMEETVFDGPTEEPADESPTISLPDLPQAPKAPLSLHELLNALLRTLIAEGLEDRSEFIAAAEREEEVERSLALRERVEQKCLDVHRQWIDTLLAVKKKLEERRKK